MHPGKINLGVVSMPKTLLVGANVIVKVDHTKVSLYSMCHNYVYLGPSIIETEYEVNVTVKDVC